LKIESDSDKIHTHPFFTVLGKYILEEMMIEQYFKSGVRFLWNKPPDLVGSMDGSLVASAGQPTSLAYDGLDSHVAAIDPSLQGSIVSATLGLSPKATVAHDWLDYAPGRTAHTKTGASDILTGYMSGCPIVRGTYGGFMSAFHVGTVVGMDAVNKLVKQAFAAALPSDATGFNPAGAWSHGEIQAKQTQLGGARIAQEKIFALITSAGAFYAILMFNVDEKNGVGAWTNAAGVRYWCVGGIKQVTPLSGATLKNLLA
jgi:hypothetical protein